MPSVPALLSQLPLHHIIGSPLVAAIEAQAMAASSTVTFIQKVGLRKNKDDQPEAIIVDFNFDRTIEETLPPDNRRNFRVVPSKLSVPLLAIVPIPFIRITDMTIDFEYKVREIETAERTEEFGVKAEVEASYWFIKAKVEGSYANKSTNKRETDQSATLRITVNAAQDNIPEGLARVLDILQEQMRVVPLARGTLLSDPGAVINSVSPFALKIPAAPAPVDVAIEGVNLDNAEVLKVLREGAVEDRVVTTIKGVPAATSTRMTLALAIDPAATPGSVVLRLATPKGIASAQIQLQKE